MHYRHKISITTLLVFLITGLTVIGQNNAIFQTTNGLVTFRSEAPMELIKGTSNQLVGFLDNDKRVFTFKINVRTFEGFNSPLQRIHFHENYVEAEKFPDAYFKGKLIEDQDLTQDGTYEIRAKGVFTLHGISKERILKTEVTVKNKKMYIKAKFTILLSDYNVPIPRVVYEKLTDEIKVEVNAILQPR